MSRRLICNISHFTHTIYSGAPFNVIVEGRGEPHNEERDYGTFLMPQNVYQPTDVGFGEAIPELIMHDGMKPVRRGGAKVIAPEELKESGEHHAWALIVKDPKWLDLGIFIADHLTGPTEAEIKLATARYTATMRRFFIDGKNAWQRFKQPQQISDRAKVAARLFRENVEWSGALDSDNRIACPGCGEMVGFKLVYHKACGAVINAEECERLGIGPYQPSPPINSTALAAAAQAAAADKGLDS